MKSFRQTLQGTMPCLAWKWAIENNPTANGIRCNANVVLANVGAKIPNSNNPNNTTMIGPVLVFPKEALANLGSNYLTTSHITYKGGDRVNRQK